MMIHPTALVEDGVTIGAGTSIWDNVHLRGPATIGSGCIVGEKTYIAYGVEVGDLVKINAAVYICTGVTIERGVMVGAHAVFTNDRLPRATDPEFGALLSSAPGPDTEATVVREGATIGASAVIGPGVEIGRFAMVGMGSIVTRSVAPFHLVAGSPARVLGYVCRCGERTAAAGVEGVVECARCRRRYQIAGGDVVEAAP